MSATFYIANRFFATERLKSGRVPFSMSNAASACMCMSAATSAFLFKTGVITSVSLFVLVLLIVPLLLLGLVVLIKFLTCLTGLVTLVSLVGLEIERTARTAKGD
jgi:hypothetical protein